MDRGALSSAELTAATYDQIEALNPTFNAVVQLLDRDAAMALAREADETAIFPLAVPSIAGPGAMLAAVLQTENQRFAVPEQIRTTLVMFSVLLVAMLLMLAASRVQRLIGESGASIISRVMGMVLAALAVGYVLGGVRGYFGI